MCANVCCTVHTIRTLACACDIALQHGGQPCTCLLKKVQSRQAVPAVSLRLIGTSRLTQRLAPPHVHMGETELPGMPRAVALGRTIAPAWLAGRFPADKGSKLRKSSVLARIRTHDLVRAGLSVYHCARLPIVVRPFPRLPYSVQLRFNPEP